MPLIASGSKRAVSENIRREIASGRPQKQAVAIAYSVKRKADNPAGMPDGGGGSDGRGVHETYDMYDTDEALCEGLESRVMAGHGPRRGGYYP